MGASAFNVLAVTKDTFILRQARLAQPLLNLRRQGLIHDFCIANPTLCDLPDDFAFDAVWVQKVDDASLLEYLAAQLDGLFLYDLDDLLLARAAYRGPDLVNREGIRRGLSLCRVLTVTSIRLGKLLERYTGLSLADRLAVCPNGAEYPAAARRPEPPQGFIFTSSDALALTTSAEAFLGAVGAFSGRHGLPVFCFGQPLARLAAAWPTMVYLGLVPYWHYHAVLAALPPMVGLAPLETEADPETLDFINGKSDIKLAEFAGHGHPGVYSQAPPYADTDLAAGVLVANRREAWEEGLEFMLREGWRTVADEQMAVKEKRRMDRLARECWLPALQRVRLPGRLTGRDLKAGLGRLRRAANALRHVLYAQDYHVMKRLQSRLPGWLLKLARRWY